MITLTNKLFLGGWEGLRKDLEAGEEGGEVLVKDINIKIAFCTVVYSYHVEKNQT